MKAPHPFYALTLLLILSFIFVPASSAQSTSLPSQFEPNPVGNEGSLVWSTFVGTAGDPADSHQDDGGYTAVDGSGNIYVAGSSPQPWGTPVQTSTPGIFIAKYNSSGTLLWHTFIPGFLTGGMALGGNGQIYAFGTTPPPSTETQDVIVSAVDGSTGELLWTTILGGDSADYGRGIAADAAGNVYVSGDSNSTWGAPLQPFTGTQPVFVAKLDAAGNLIWNTFLAPGINFGEGITVDADGNIFLTGWSSNSWGEPVADHNSPTLGNSADAFVAKLYSDGQLAWNTFLGAGAQNETGWEIAVDGAGNLFVVGDSSGSWGTPLNPFGGGSADAFVARLAADGTLIWNTFLGGPGYDSAANLALDGAGNVFVGGQSNAAWGSPLRAFQGGYDSFAAALAQDGSLSWHTFLGSTGEDYGTSVSVDASGNLYAGGTSQATWGSPLNPFVGYSQVFLAKLTGVDASPVTISGSAGALGAGAVLSYMQDGPRLVVTDGSGNYSITVPSGWSGSVQPSKAGTYFEPQLRAYSAIVANQTEQNYAASPTPPALTITGNAGTPGATLIYLAGGLPQEATADGSGGYSLSVPYGWNGTVTPYKEGLSFAPASRSYPTLTSSQAGQDFTTSAAPPLTISGNAGTPDAVLSYDAGGPQTVTADENGDYLITVPYAWSGTITPTTEYDLFFIPRSRTYTRLAADKTGQYFEPEATDLAISGSAGLPGVTLSYVTDGPHTVISSEYGWYTIIVPLGWSGTLTPSKPGVAFAPASRTYSNELYNRELQDFIPGPANPVTISGNAGTPGATLSYVWEGNRTVTADSSGLYSISVPSGWSGTITPSKPGLLFLPFSRSYASITDDQTDQDYAASPPVTISGNAGIGGALLSYTYGGTKYAYASSNGDYTINVPTGWTGTVTPSKCGKVFDPASRSYTEPLASNQVDQDYLASTGPSVTISGNAGTPDAALSYYILGTKYTAVSNASGDYSFTVPSGWTGQVSVFKLGFSFDPEYRNYSSCTMVDQLGQDYISTAQPPRTISGNAGAAGTQLEYNSGGPQVAIADENGDYTLSVPYGWSGSIAPFKVGLRFFPPSYSYTNLRNNISGLNFTTLASTVQISGYSGAPGTTLSYDVDGPQTAIAGGNGYYTITVPYGWSGTVTPSRPHTTFDPASRSYERVFYSTSAQNYTGVFECFNLALSHTGQGNDPITHPQAPIGCPAGQYYYGQSITLTGIAGLHWHLVSWSGTDDDSLTTVNNVLTMPAADHAVGVAYEPTVYTLQVTSQPARDGWILESSEGSSLGGKLNYSSTLFSVGDNAGDRQYRAILSFNTNALPWGAQVTGAQLKIRRASVAGTNPFSTHGNLKLDIRTGYFGTSPELELVDFKGGASLANAGFFTKKPVDSWYTATLGSAAYSLIAPEALVQFRLRFALDDDDDLVADIVRFFSGNAETAFRPVLIFQYIVP